MNKFNQKLNIRNIFSKPKDLLFTFATIFLIAVLSISNLSTSVLLIKTLSIFIIYTLVIVKKKNNFTKQITEDIKATKYFLFLLVPAIISLTYTSNLSYGASKIFNIIINIPILIIIMHYISELDLHRKKSLVFSIGILTILSLILILLIDPFDQSRLYVFELTRWSHVIFSRTMALLFFIILIMFINIDNLKTELLLAIIMTLQVYQIYYANLRAATFGLIIFFVLIIIFAISKKQLNFIKSLILALTLTLSLLFIIITPRTEYFNFRYTESAKLLEGELPKEGGINARLIAYENALDIIIENPFLGIGIGGFNGYNGDEFLSVLKYPHNIFLEFQVELGLLGSAFFIFYLITTFRLLYRFNIYLLIFWLFTIWLALFAKDIASNLLVFLPLVLYDNNIRFRFTNGLVFTSDSESSSA